MRWRLGIALAMLAAVGLTLTAGGTDSPAEAPAEAPVGGAGEEGDCADGDKQEGCEGGGAVPAPETTTTTTTIPYACTGTDKPDLVVKPQEGRPVRMWGERQADYVLPEAQQGGEQGFWIASIEMEAVDGCLPSGAVVYYRIPQEDISHTHTAVEANGRDVEMLSTGQAVIGRRGYAAELRVKIHDNQDDQQHAGAVSGHAFRTQRAGCVEFFEVVPNSDHRNAATQHARFGSLGSVLVAIDGNMPHCEGRYG